MTALPPEQTAPRPLWLILPTAAALAWNVFGRWQVAGVLTQTQDSLMADGMAAQAGRFGRCQR